MTDLKRHIVLFLAAFATVSAVLFRPTIAGIDGQGNYAYLLSVLRSGDLDFTDDYAFIDAQQDKHYRLSDAPRSEVTGLPANRYGPGAALFWAPAVGAVHLGLRWLRPDLATGLSPPYKGAVALSSAFWAGLGLLLLFRRICREFGAFAGWLVAALVAFATSFCFYVWLHGSMSHAVSFFVAVMAVLSLEKAWGERTWSSATLAGFWAGLLTTTRFQDASWTFALGVGVLGLWPSDEVSGNTRRLSSRWAAAAFFGAGSAVSLLPQLAVWKVLYGSWLSGPLPYLNREGGHWEAIPRNLLNALFSERGGVFGWHPVLLFSLVGLVCCVRNPKRPLVPVLLLGIGLQVYVVSGWSMWWAGDSFGNRFFVSSYPAFAFGLAWLTSQFRTVASRRWLAVAAGVLIAWNMGLLIQYGTKMVPRHEEVGWPRVVRNQLVEVPAWILDQIQSVSR